MPNWLGTQVPDGQPLGEANIQDFLQDQPMVKFPYFTMGEVSAEDIQTLINKSNALTYVP